MNNIGSKKILITGSSGFIGKHLVRKLTEDSPGFTIIECDKANGINLLDIESLMDLPSVNAVIHLAAIVSVVDSFKNPYEYYYNNYLSTLNILEFCRVKQVERIIYSSSYVYGMPKYLPIDESHPVDISNPYGRSKLFAEQLINAYCQDYEIKGIILRNFNIFGYGQNHLFLIPTIIEQLFSNKEIVEIGDLSPKRDLIYIKDIIEVFTRCLELKTSNLEIFNVGSGKAFSVEQVINALFEVSGIRKKVKCNSNIRKNEIPCTIADNSKLKEALKWQPKYTLESGLRDLIKYYGEKNVQR